VAKGAAVNLRRITKLVREGDLVAEVRLEVMEVEEEWSPYISLEDAQRLDDVREAQLAQDLKRASRLAHRLRRLTPVSV
jgi:hypothetical protein